LYLINGQVTGAVKTFYENGELKRVSIHAKDTPFVFGEFNEQGKVIGDDFFLDIITPDSILLGEDVSMRVILYNTDIFEYCKILKGEFIDGGEKIVISEKLKIKDDKITIKLPTNSKGFNYWSGILEYTSKLGTSKYAPYPICFSYLVK
jgi:hypothetical protein